MPGGRFVTFFLPFCLVGLVGLVAAGCAGMPAASRQGTAEQSVARAAAAATAVPLVPLSTTSSSDALVDSVGVNVHLNYFGTLYGDNFPLILSRLTGLGARHVRDGAGYGASYLCDEDLALAQNGIHLDAIVPMTTDTADLIIWAECARAAIDLIEGPNEYDVSGDPNWATNLRSFQQTIYTNVEGIAPIPIIAPSLVSESDFAVLGSVAGMAGLGNMHDYFAGRNPETTGWGGTDAFGTYGSLSWNMAIAAQASGSLPIASTETGYSDQSDTYAVPPATKMDYTLRTILVHWLAGVPHTYIYELLDEGGAPFAHYGLLDAAGNPKPAYVALRNFLSHLADPGASFALRSLGVSIGASADVRSLLLQKRAGTFELILWNEVPEWDPVGNAPIAVPPQTVTLSFASAPSSIRTNTFDSGGNLVSKSLAAAGTVTVQATGTPTIVDIAP